MNDTLCNKGPSSTSEWTMNTNTKILTCMWDVNDDETLNFVPRILIPRDIDLTSEAAFQISYTFRALKLYIQCFLHVKIRGNCIVFLWMLTEWIEIWFRRTVIIKHMYTFKLDTVKSKKIFFYHVLRIKMAVITTTRLAIVKLK